MCLSFLACPRGVPFMMCVANPCEGSSCPANPKAKCRANSCGQCTPKFFDDNDKLIDCAASKYCNLSAMVKSKPEKIRSNEGLMLKTSAFESFYGGQFTLSTQLIKPNYLTSTFVQFYWDSPVENNNVC